MFYILRDNTSYNQLWHLVTANQGSDIFDQFNLEEYLPEHAGLAPQHLNLLYCNEYEGICGKASFFLKDGPLESLNFENCCKSSKPSMLLIQDIAFYINAQSSVHYDHDELGTLAQQFYKALIKEVYQLCDVLSLSHIITLSKSQDDHEDLIFYGDIEFISEHKTSKGTFGVTPFASTKGDGRVA